MPRLDLASRTAISLIMQGYYVMDVKKRLEEENVVITRQSLYKLLRKHRTYHTNADSPRNAVPKKITPEMYLTIESELTKDDEVTASHLRNTLKEKHPSLEVSLTTTKRALHDLDWLCTRPHYYQLIREGSFSLINLLVQAKVECGICITVLRMELC